MKRRAAADDEEYVPRTRRRVAGPSSLREEVAFDEEHINNDATSEADSEYAEHGSRSRSTPSTASTPQTSISVVSTSRKFPSDLKTIRCTFPNCDKAFNRPARLAAHLRSHNNERPYKCTYEGCGKDYIEEKHLRQHLKAAHTGEREFPCPEPGCDKSFLTSTRLRRHQAVHEGQERFRCRDYPPCNQSFRKHQTLQRHIRADHLGKPAFACSQKDSLTNEPCDASFDTANALKRHNEREHGVIRFWCDECANTLDKDGQPTRVGFPTPEMLQKHMQRAHINCMFCERVFPSREELDHHVDSQHSKSTLSQRKSVPCTWPGCTRTFVKNFNMIVHVRSVHEGFRYKCGEVDLSRTPGLEYWNNADGCGNGFVTKGNLEDHVRYVHLSLPRPQHGRGSVYKPADGANYTPPENAMNNLLGGLSGVTDRTYRTMPCMVPGCALKFASKADLEDHIKTQHLSAFMDQALQTQSVVSPQVQNGSSAVAQPQNRMLAANAQAQHLVGPTPQNHSPSLAMTTDNFGQLRISPAGIPIPQFREQQHFAGDAHNANNQGSGFWSENQSVGTVGITGYHEHWLPREIDENLIDPALNSISPHQGGTGTNNCQGEPTLAGQL